MVKFYFFRVGTETNPRGQMRTIARPVDGQTSFDAYGRNTLVDSSYKIQLDLRENHKLVQLQAGSIVGIRMESDSFRYLALKVRTRDGEAFYRVENEIFLVVNSYYTTRADYPEWANQEMLDAWRAFNHPTAGDTAPSPSQATQEAPAPSAAPSPSPTYAPPTRVATPIAFSPNELSDIEYFLMDRLGDEREALSKLLIISQIRDRMRLGVAKFVFRKQDGEIRTAYGTRNGDVMARIQYRESGGGGNRQNDGGHFVYFDVEKCDWRCFCTDDIMSVSVETLITDPATIDALSHGRAA